MSAEQSAALAVVFVLTLLCLTGLLALRFASTQQGEAGLDSDLSFASLPGGTDNYQIAQKRPLVKGRKAK